MMTTLQTTRCCQPLQLEEPAAWLQQWLPLQAVMLAMQLAEQEPAQDACLLRVRILQKHLHLLLRSHPQQLSRLPCERQTWRSEQNSAAQAWVRRRPHW